MGFKVRDGGNFKPQQNHVVKNPREEQLAIFKIVVIQMIAEGRTDDEIVAFADNPTPTTRFGKESNTALESAFFGGILKYTTKSEREKVLLEIE